MPDRLKLKMSNSEIIEMADSSLNIIEQGIKLVPYEVNRKNTISIIWDDTSRVAEVNLNCARLMVAPFDEFNSKNASKELRVMGYLEGQPNWSGAYNLALLVSKYIKGKTGREPIIQNLVGQWTNNEIWHNVNSPVNLYPF